MHKIKLMLLNSGVWVLLENLTATTSLKVDYTVEKGFKTDLATIPRVFWCLIAPADVAPSSIVHDKLLRDIASAKIKSRFKRLASWRLANSVMFDLMSNSPLKPPLWRRFLIYKAINTNAIIKCLIFNKHPDLLCKIK